MRVAGSDYIWDLWQRGGPFIGEDRPNAVVTVEKGWWLHLSHEINIGYHMNLPEGPLVGDGDIGPPGAAVRTQDGRTWYNTAGTGYGPESNMPPLRSFAREAGNQIETEVPNIEQIDIDRSIDQDAATCRIVLANQKMLANEDVDPESGFLEGQLGLPGYYSPTRNEPQYMNRAHRPLTPIQEKRALWNQHTNDWSEVLGPNCLLRTYQGYNGHDKTWQEAVEDGNLVQTGTWLVDKVTVSTDGKLVLECRDMAKLLLDQLIYPPLMPAWRYPLEYYRWKWVKKQIPTFVGNKPVYQKRPVRFLQSANDLWYPDSVVPGKGTPIHGHYGSDAFDGNLNSFWLSVGNSHPSRPFSTSWIEFSCGEEITAVKVAAWGGPYSCFVSVDEGSGWVGGANVVPYDHTPLIGRQPHVVDTGADIPFIAKSQIGGRRNQSGKFVDPYDTIRLPRKMKARKIRLSFRDHKQTQWGPWKYRVGIRDIQALNTIGAKPQYKVEEKTVKVPGNHSDYSDIVKELLLWSGWWLRPAIGYVKRGQKPMVYGNIESTGAWSEEPLPRDMFDKKAVIEPINEIAGIVGYNFWIDEEGAVRFEAPNWFEPGNFDVDGSKLDFIPEVNENHNLLSHGTTMGDAPIRSQIIIATADPTEDYKDTVKTIHWPRTKDVLRGMVKPAMWVNGQYFTNPAEQQVMAELINLRMFFAQRQSSSECVGNPCLSINDQVRIVERMTSSTYCHYVRGLSSSQNIPQGTYTMSLNTHWLGNRETWAIQPPEKGPWYQRYYIVQEGDDWNFIRRELKNRYGTEWTENFLKWVNQEQLHQTGGALYPGMVLAV